NNRYSNGILLFLFQFTPLREGRLPARPVQNGWKMDFNSRPCVRGDPASFSSQSSRQDFNSRPCVRGDGNGVSKSSADNGDFNSRPCVRGDPPKGEAPLKDELISIHAPA